MSMNATAIGTNKPANWPYGYGKVGRLMKVARNNATHLYRDQGGTAFLCGRAATPMDRLDERDFRHEHKSWCKDCLEAMKGQAGGGKAKPGSSGRAGKQDAAHTEKFKLPPDEAIRQAKEDWLSHRAYVDNQGNYHIRTERIGEKVWGGKSVIAPWNKEVKRRFKNVSDFSKAVSEGAAEKGQDIPTAGDCRARVGRANNAGNQVRQSRKETPAEQTGVGTAPYRMDRRAQAVRGAFYGCDGFDALNDVIARTIGHFDEETGTWNGGCTLAEAMGVVDALTQKQFQNLTRHVPEDWWQ